MRMLTIEEVAHELRVAPKTVRDWRYRQSKGRPAPPLEFRKYGGVVRVTALSVAVVQRGSSVGDFVGTERFRVLPWPGGGVA